MSSGSDPGGIGRPEAGPLIDALRDDSQSTRIAALDALTRLPLEPDAWFEVRDYVHRALEETGSEHTNVIPLAGRIPIRSVRLHLLNVAENGTPKARRAASLALGRAGDAEAFRPLLALLEDSGSDSEIAEALAMVDTYSVQDDVEQLWSTLGDRNEGDRTGFWLTVALARNGRGEPLAAELERMSTELVFVDDAGETQPYSSPGDDVRIYTALERIVPLPEEVRAALDRKWESSWVDGLVSEVLFSPPGDGEHPSHPRASWRRLSPKSSRRRNGSSCRRHSGTGCPSTTSIRQSPW